APPTHLGRLRPDLPSEGADMVMRALSVNKDDRPKSMTEFALVLLPHGNSAFGLWVKVEGKQPALATTRTLTPGLVTPSAPSNPFHDGAASGPKPRAPSEPTPSTERKSAPAPPTPPAASSTAPAVPRPSPSAKPPPPPGRPPPPPRPNASTM